MRLRVFQADDKGDGAGGGNATADAGKTETKTGATGGETMLAKAGAETKTGDATKTETKGDAKETKPAPVDYEKWSPKEVQGLKRPEPTVKAFRDAGKKFGLSAEQMQGLVDFDDERTKTLAAEYRTERERTQKAGLEAFKNDKEFGGSKLSETQADFDRLMKEYGDDELRKLLDDTGYGDHPALLRFVARLGKATREDSVTGGPKNGADGAGKKKPTLIEQLYGTAKS